VGLTLRPPLTPAKVPIPRPRAPIRRQGPGRNAVREHGRCTRCSFHNTEIVPGIPILIVCASSRYGSHQCRRTREAGRFALRNTPPSRRSSASPVHNCGWTGPGSPVLGLAVGGSSRAATGVHRSTAYRSDRPSARRAVTLPGSGRHEYARSSSTLASGNHQRVPEYSEGRLSR